MEKRIGTVGDAARIALVSVPTIRNWAKAGKLQAYRTPGGVRLFDLDEVEQLARSRKVAV